MTAKVLQFPRTPQTVRIMAAIQAINDAQKQPVSLARYAAAQRASRELIEATVYGDDPGAA